MPTPRRAQSDRVFYGAMGVAIAAIVLVGFSPTFYLAPRFHRLAPSPFRVVHGLLFTAWIVLFVAQTALITTRRVAVHRRVGTVGALLAAAMVVMGTSLAIIAAREGHAPPGIDPRAFMIVPLFDMLIFAALVGSALYLRRRPQAHKRLMLLATISLLGAAAARLPAGYHLPGVPVLYGFAVVDTLVLLAVLHDLATRRMIHQAYIAGGLLIIASEPLRMVIGGTHAWTAIAALLIGR